MKNIKNLHSARQLKINTAPNPIVPGDGGGDGGFPPPSTTDPTVCPAPTDEQDITNNVKDQCLHNMVDAAVAKNIQFNATQSMDLIFNI